jgi:hypothetical protein
MQSVVDLVARRERYEIAVFLERVRLPGSGLVAAACSRLTAWQANRIEREAQRRFSAGRW